MSANGDDDNIFGKGEPRKIKIDGKDYVVFFDETKIPDDNNPAELASYVLRGLSGEYVYVDPDGKVFGLDGSGGNIKKKKMNNGKEINVTVNEKEIGDRSSYHKFKDSEGMVITGIQGIHSGGFFGGGDDGEFGKAGKENVYGVRVHKKSEIEEFNRSVNTIFSTLGYIRSGILDHLDEEEDMDVDDAIGKIIDSIKITDEVDYYIGEGSGADIVSAELSWFKNMLDDINEDNKEWSDISRNMVIEKETRSSDLLYGLMNHIDKVIK